MTHAAPGNRRTTLISFSGIDGAGKSTQIEILVASLKQAGFRVARLAFWDDVAMLTGLREFSGHALFKGEKGVGAPEKPVNRQDKNIQSWYMTAVRFALYLLDAISLSFVTAKQRRSAADVIIFDRYLYDELANLALDNRISRIYARFLLTLTPHPDIAYLLDANPEKARERKPEYPVEFLRKNRAAYLTVAELGSKMTLIAPLPVADAADQILDEALRKLPANDLHSFPASAQTVATDPKAS